MFNMLVALPQLNWLLLSAVDTLLAHDLDFHVFHIPGHENVVADHLSRGCLAEAVASAPGLCIHTFEPPQDTLGAASITVMEISPLARQPVREAWPLKRLIFERCRADSAVECILMLDYLLYCYLPLLPTYLLP